MNKETWSGLKDRIRKLPLAEVIERTLSRIPERKGMINDPRDVRFLCPFHDDHSGRHFGVYKTKYGNENYHCFVCGETGDCFKFVMSMMNCNFQQAVLFIAVDFGLITKEEFEEVTKNPLEFKPRGETKYQARETNLVRMANIDKRDKVYSLIKELSPLSKEDREYLNSRSIDDKEINLYGYFTMPHEDVIPRLLEALKATPETLLGVPGFYWDKAENRLRMTEMDGIAIPIRNADRQIEALQVRFRGAVTKGPRYKFLSSKFTDFDRFREKFEKGCGPRSTVGVVYPYEIDNLNKIVCITEGMFKATKFATAFKAIGLTVQGVTNTKGVIPDLEKLKERFRWQAKKPIIVLAFDMDMYENRQVFKATKKLEKELEQAGWTVRIAQWDERWKGLDDFIIANPDNVSHSIRLKKLEDVEKKIKAKEQHSSQKP